MNSIFYTKDLRHFPNLLFSVPHYSNEDTTINGYTIPAGTTILSNLDAVLFSADTWKDPLEFRPERFLDAHGNVTQPEQFVAYSIGNEAEFLFYLRSS